MIKVLSFIAGVAVGVVYKETIVSEIEAYKELNGKELTKEIDERVKKAMNNKTNDDSIFE